MDALLLKLAEELNSSVFVLLGLLFFCFFLCWQACAFLTTWRIHRAETLQKQTEAEEVKRKVIGLDATVGKAVDFGDRIVRIETKLDLIYNVVNPNAMTRSQSPIALTDKGRETAQGLNAAELLAAHYPRLQQTVTEAAPQNAYDIQQAAFKAAREQLPGLLSSADINKLKDTAFANGVLFEDILSIFGVLLRDRLLDERNIPTTDIDLHAPR